MKIRLTNGKAAAPGDIAALQRRIGTSLPSDYLEFIAVNDGARAQSNSFKVGLKNGSDVTGFIQVKEIIKAMSIIEDLPPKAFPITRDSCGNYVYIDQGKNGAVFFWDHEVPESTRIADRFSSFLEMIEPFDVASVKLKPGQVKSVWIDPEFLKKIREQEK